MDQEKIGKFINKLRKDKNLTQEQLANKMGVSINAVSKWERGLSLPDVSLFKDLCNELSISIEELINGEKDNSEEAKVKAIINTIKSKEKTRKKLYFVISISIIIISILSIIGFMIYKKSVNKDKELDKFYERNYQKTFVVRNVEAIMKYRNDGKYPDYYGGMYISDDAYNLILLIVKNKIPRSEYGRYYYNELITLDDSIKVEYVDNSYNDLEKVYNVINSYFESNELFNNINSVYIDIFKNKVIVNYSKLDENAKQEFKNKVIDSDLIEFEQSDILVDINNKCTNYPSDLGDTKLSEHGQLLMSIEVGNIKYGIPVLLALYDDNTYELFTTYFACPSNVYCTSILIYLKSIKGKYNYDLKKIIDNSVRNDRGINSDNLPEYEINLGEKYMLEYDSMTFLVEKGRKNKYLDELLEQINVDLYKCAKGEYENINYEDIMPNRSNRISETKKIVINGTSSNLMIKKVTNQLEVNEIVNIISSAKKYNNSVVSSNESTWDFYMYDSNDNLISIVKVWNNGRITFDNSNEIYNILPTYIESFERIISSGLN